MNNTIAAGPPVRRRWALIAAGAVALFASFFVAAPAQAGYYDAAYPCTYRCGYPAYSYYRPYRPVYRHRCYSCGGSRLIYERRYVEREYIERRYGYGGYRRHYGYYPYGYRRHYYGYPRYGAYRGYSRPYGFGGIGRRWSLPYTDGYDRSRYYDRSGYYEPPRPPAPVSYEGDYY